MRKGRVPSAANAGAGQALVIREVQHPWPPVSIRCDPTLRSPPLAIDSHGQTSRRSGSWRCRRRRANPVSRPTPTTRSIFEPSPRRVRVKFNGEIIADSTNAHLLFETRHLPVYYFPRSDVRMDRMTATDHHTFCPYKGTASYWTIAVGDKVAENAVWGYPDPFDEVAAIKDFLAFYWDRVDAWYEEDEEIFVHPRDPYKRVDVLDSSRPVQVVVGGQWSPRRGARGFSSRRGCRPAITSRPRMCAGIFSCRARRSPAALTRARQLLLGQDRGRAVQRSRLDATPTRSPNARRSKAISASSTSRWTRSG